MANRDGAARMMVVGGAKLGVVGVLAALMGTAVKLGWIDMRPHQASEMAIPTMLGGSLMGLFAIFGMLIATSPMRRELWPTALRWVVGAIAMGAWGMWLYGP